MKRLNFTLITALIMVVVSACTSTTTEKPKEEAATVVDQHHEQSERVKPIELNSNEKWLVNNEMKPFLKTGSTIVEEYKKSGRNDYKALAIQLNEQNKQLIASCTMKGKSHDELHKWLTPHLKLVADLEKSTDEVEARELITKLIASYALYNQYFQ